MRPLMLPAVLLLSGVAGLAFLVAYLWYRHALYLHAELYFPDDAVGIRMLRYGGTTGLAAFGGFLLAFVFHLLVTEAGGRAVAVGFPLLETAVGLFLLSVSTFVMAGVGYGADALRAWLESVR